MALIDVSELMVDPDFIDAIQINRRSSTIGSNGRNTVAVTSVINGYASVQPADAKILARLPESYRDEDIRVFYTKTPVLEQTTTSQYPDQIIWQGNLYEVRKSSPWGNFGAGYFQVIAVRQKAAP